LNLPKTLTIKPVLLISLAVAIPASVLTFIPASALTAILTFAPTFIILMVPAPALAELTLSLIPEMAALSPATCIPTEP
jgi:hypothetical protein